MPATAVVARPDATKQAQVVRVQHGRAQWVSVRKGQLLSRDTLLVFGALTPGDELVREASGQVAEGQPVTDAKGKPAGS